jgi:fumarate reductase subunit C
VRRGLREEAQVIAAFFSLVVLFGIIALAVTFITSWTEPEE